MTSVTTLPPTATSGLSLYTAAITSSSIPPAATNPTVLSVGQIAALIAIAVLIASAGTYLTLRTRQKREASWRVCSSCGWQNRPENEYCAKCGSSLADQTRVY
jgi:ribosomal protein L40E